MALVSDGFVLNVQLSDAAGNKASLRFDLNYADWAALNTAVGAAEITGIITDLDAVTDASIVGYTVGERFADEAAPYGAAGSEVEMRASLSAKLNSRLDRVTLNIPAPVDGLFVATTGPDRNLIDASDVDLLAWLANFEAGTGPILVSDGEQLDTVATAGNVKGKRVHRGSRKG